MTGKNLESACRAYQRTKFERYSNRADRLAEEAARHPAGSPEWRKAAAAFVALVNEAKRDGVELLK